ncbi:uncharacterized protein LOC143908273 [Temnothorax americanus]|uniref:uncharacterized protein LOC143908273 n=1 Tax=Temnothorax americanus TaxID=1964332 RepID=UPI00406786CE
MSCSVKGCGNYYRKTKLLDGNSIKYFSFPKDFTIAAKWLAACGKQNVNLNVNIKKSMICSQHFDASCFVQPSKEKSLFYAQKRLTKLRPDAIPTLRLMCDAPQMEAVRYNKRSLPLIDTSDMSELICNDTSTSKLTCNDTSTSESTCNDTSTSESTCNDTVLFATFGDDIPVSKEIQSINTITALPSTSKDVTALLKILNSVQEQLAATQKNLLMYKEKEKKGDENAETKIYQILGKIFTPGQIRMLLNPSKKRISWSPEDIASAISLRSISPKAYRYLRNVLQIPLPGPSTLRRSQM